MENITLPTNLHYANLHCGKTLKNDSLPLTLQNRMVGKLWKSALFPSQALPQAHYLATHTLPPNFAISSATKSLKIHIISPSPNNVTIQIREVNKNFAWWLPITQGDKTFNKEHYIFLHRYIYNYIGINYLKIKNYVLSLASHLMNPLFS